MEARALRPNALDQNLSIADAELVGRELYDAFEQAGSRRIGWKIGATDPAVQANLGSSGPFAAPLYELTSISSGARVSLSSLVAPRLEPEIGLLVDRDGLRPLPCLEIADCRISDWRVSFPAAIADFGLHGLVMFGPAGESPDDLEVTVSRDSEEIIRTVASIPSAVGATEILSDALGHSDLIATGSLTAAIPLSPGTWKVDFGSLGSLTLEVER